MQPTVPKRSIANLYPGTRVPLGPGADQYVTVYPIGIQHIEEHAEVVTRIAAELLPFFDSIQAGGITERLLTEVVPGIVRYARKGLLDFVNHFVDVDIFTLSFEHQGRVLEAFLVENLFRPGVLTAWSNAAAALWKTIVGDSMTPSPNSPPPASTPTASSTETGDSPTEESHSDSGEAFVAALDDRGNVVGPMTPIPPTPR